MRSQSEITYEVFISDPIPQAIATLLPNGDHPMWSPMSSTLIYGPTEAVHGVIGAPEGIKSQPFGHLSEIVHLGPALSARKDAKADPLCSTARPRMHTRAGGEGVLC